MIADNGAELEKLRDIENHKVINIGRLCYEKHQDLKEPVHIDDFYLSYTKMRPLRIKLYPVFS